MQMASFCIFGEKCKVKRGGEGGLLWGCFDNQRRGMKVGKDGIGKIGRRGMRWVLGWVWGV